jgi:hypothetical protein
VIDEGASTWVMYMSCWKSLASPNIYTFATLLKELYRHMFQSHGIITTSPIDLGGKTIYVVVEVIDAPIEYNLLLGRTWFYEMNAFVSSVFNILCFPHQGKIVSIDQLMFCTPYLGSNVRSNVPFVGDTQQSHMSMDVRMFKDPSLIGIFPLPPPPPIKIILYQ